MPGVGHLKRGQLLRVRIDLRGEPPQQRGSITRRNGSPGPLCQPAATIAASACSADAPVTVRTGCSVAGLSTV